MILYPAIDLKDGNCVRLLRGEMEKATVFSESPADQAAAFEKAGFEYLHIVDLNGAFEGKPVNEKAVRAILARVKMPVQLGGGIRDLAMIANWLEAGVSRVILGTLALKHPQLVKEACRLFPGQIAVGIDAKGGRVAIEGWAEVSGQSAADLAKKFEDTGVCAIIYTDISRDGAMQGPNVEETVKLAESITTPVIASGGISSIEDIKRYKEFKTSGIEGCILGRALYEGKIRADEALAICNIKKS
ncbi:MAG: 1-(5-phosphoribosyl)-5-[(5-phosphoribosylamino)methylideneamino]imidazole-4-carboxamide isomerase [Pseudomonadota bacterium]|nr:1-(5-phosphoribosyl)-5-[(5-phosphoribosylamino)methylideneamino]imidazole-4-carboxamide isomerase [Pseudomonadota bacterium]MDE3038207.1 1-(5-phosphoribosyl)-5-[(5-phosphoribosylamino)methylideneamino]imidazole-4-carboxamide isomerase [Pseudomonadota bacterium]